MTINTISDLSADDLVKLVFAKRLRSANKEDLTDDTKYAVVLLKLNNAVTTDDYPALKTSIEDISGITNASLLIDHQTKATVPENHTQVLRINADVTLRDDTPEEE